MSRSIRFVKSFSPLKMPRLPKDHLTRTLLQAADRGNFGVYQEAISHLKPHEKQALIAKFDCYALKAFMERGNEEASLTLFLCLNETQREQKRYWLINELAKKGKFEAVYDMFFPYDNAKNALIVSFENYRLLDHAAFYNNYDAASYYLSFLSYKQIKESLSKDSFKVLTIFAKYDNLQAVNNMLDKLSDKDSETAAKAANFKIIKIFAQNGNYQAVQQMLHYLSDQDIVKALQADNYLVIKSFAENLDIQALTLLFEALSDAQIEEALLSNGGIILESFLEAGRFLAYKTLLDYMPASEHKVQLLKDNCYALRMMAKNNDESKFFTVISFLDLSDQVSIFEAKEFSIIRNFAANNNFHAIDRIFAMMGDDLDVFDVLSAKNFVIIRNFALIENSYAVSQLIFKLSNFEKLAALEILGQYDLPQMVFDYLGEETNLAGADALAEAA